MVDRQSVRENAQYLREVRPVDPEEIHEYVPGAPHPAVVRRVLREEAADLRLREREDGTFVPASEEPAPRVEWEPTRFPERYSRAVEDLLVERYGANWHRGDSGDELRTAISRLKSDYFFGNDVRYDEPAALGYALYHLPDYYAVAGYVLGDLAERGLLPRTLRVLDVGAGAGGPALGLHDYLPDDAVVDYHAVEPSAAADVLKHMLAETGRNFRPTVHRERAQSVAFEEPFDLVCANNVLGEVDDPVAVARDLLDWTAADGTLLLTAPADLETSTGLRKVERALVPAAATGDDDAPSVYAPTLRLWPGEAPTDRGWSFDVRPELEPAPFQTRLEEASAGDADPGTYIKTSVQFSYSLVRPDGARRLDARASPERHAKMAAMDDHVTERVDLLAVKLSHDLTDEPEANPLFKIGDGSQTVDHYAVVTRASVLNRDLLAAPYGAVVAFENALALWNDDEEAYNLVLDGESVADVVAV
ncbi:MAG: methyltransferase domain-containing protein [Halolamina sp.]